MFKNSLQTDKNTKYAGSAELLSAEINLIRYNRDIVKQIVRKTTNRIRILEFGAGIGTLAREYKGATGIKPECVEIDTIQAGIIMDRGFICYSSVDEIGAHIKYDAIYTSNVLEHIENDCGAISLLGKHLKRSNCSGPRAPRFVLM
jgi:2-polyprenyl-3-methyl-5-hydroxy-6-metoxy-1,4-benzoquinol methylase